MLNSKLARLMAGSTIGLYLSSGFAATFTVTNTLSSGSGSLAQAINDANANPGPDVIQFNIPPGGPQTITNAGFQPTVTDPVTIDGTTQPGFSGQPIIELRGLNPTSGTGLLLISSSNTVRGLILNRFITGLYLYDHSSGNRIEGNWIGVDATGELGLGMSGDGILIESGTDNIIGGTNAAARNVIASATNNAIYIYYGARNVVMGNYLGSGASGTNAVGNGWRPDGGWNYAAGVFIEQGISNTVGGTVAGAGNLISGNARGVVLMNHSSGNVIQGNWIGLDATGSSAMAGRKQISGVRVDTSDGNLIGGTESNAGNVISGHDGGALAPLDGAGIEMYGAQGNIVQGNLIGTDPTGTLSISNRINGISLNQVSRTNLIGGTVAGARNVISGNGVNGIYLRNASDNLIQGNYIGTGADGASPLGNGENGVYLYSGADNSIGGTSASSGNRIAFNGLSSAAFFRNGVTLAQLDAAVSSTGNLIRRNSIFSNGDLGIRLYDVNCITCSPHNDLNDTDFGVNNLQNTPVLASASTSAGTISITGTLNSAPNAGYTIEFFANPEMNASGYGEGKTYLGSTGVVTDSSGNTAFTAYFVDPGVTGQYISATATDSGKNTSEFAADVVADGPAGAVQFSQAVYTQTESGGLANIQVKRVAGTNGVVTVHYSTSDGTATEGSDYTATSGILTFAAGETVRSFDVPILNDSSNELDETVILTLDSPSGGAVLGPLATAVLTILDDDYVYVYAGDAGATKPGSGTTTLLLPVYLSQPAPRTVSVSYGTSDLTAQAGVDYLSATGRIDFVPGVTNQFVPVTILADGLQEGSKSLLLTLSQVTNAVFGDSTALGTIYDGTQGVLQFSASNYTIAEEGGAATITVSRVGGSLGPVSVSFNIVGGTATPGEDYTPTNGVLSFNSGETSRSFSVPIIDDSVPESDETVVFQLSNPTNTSLGVPATAVLTIQDTDLPRLSIQSMAGSVALLWPTQAAGFQLVSSPALPLTDWTEVTNTPVVSGSQFAVTNLTAETNRFYRLRR